jgi:hypothetical protein
VSVCASCGHENRSDLHFCENCGDYLQWDQPSEVLRGGSSPVPPEPAEPPEAPAAATAEVPGAVVPPAAGEPVSPAPAAAREPGLVLSAGPPHPGAPGTRVEPGGAASLNAVVRNQSGIVDAFDVALVGLPGEWWRADPPLLHLLPLGATGGACEAPVVVVVEPPRAPEARAGYWPVRLTATSRSDPARSGSATARIDIAPYAEIEADLHPERVIAGSHADYRLTIANRGNVTTPVHLRGEDADGRVDFRFDPATLSLEPGQEAVVEVRASAPRPTSGQDRDRRLRIHAEAGEATAALSALFVQRPRIRAATVLWWRVLLTLAAAALLIVGSFLDWVDDLRGICLDDATGCLSYDVYLDRAVDVQVERPDPPEGVAGLVDAVTSLGVVTVLLGLLVLLGARTARLVWIAGAAAIVYLVAVLATLSDAGAGGSWLAILGGVLAIAASLVAGIRRSG